MRVPLYAPRVSKSLRLHRQIRFRKGGAKHERELRACDRCHNMKSEVEVKRSF